MCSLLKKKTLPQPTFSDPTDLCPQYSHRTQMQIHALLAKSSDSAHKNLELIAPAFSKLLRKQ